MHAIERLRYVARSGDVDATELACEAAYALAGLSRDRRALVLAGRRLLEFHPRCGPLWWVVAHALVTDDLRSTVIGLVKELEDDAAVDELFALPDSQTTVLCEATRTVVRGLCERPDLSVRLVGDRNAVRSGMRFFSGAFSPPQGFITEEIGQAISGANAVVVEALAAGPSGYLLADAGQALAEAALSQGVPLWVVAGVGRVLPPELFDVLIAHLAVDEQDVVNEERSDAVLAGLVDNDDQPSIRAFNKAVQSLIPVNTATLVVTPSGLREPKLVFHSNRAVSHQRCPVPSELLAPFGLAG